MQNLISQSDVPVVKGWKVGNLNGGETRYDLSKQWISRPHDQRFLSLNDLKAHVARCLSIRHRAMLARYLC